MKAKKDKFPFLALHRPWADNPNGIWLASSLSLHRNLRAYLFPSKLSAEERTQVLSLLTRELVKSPGLDQPRLIKAEEIGPLEKEFLFEHFLQITPFQQALEGEGFVVDQTGEAFALINITDHLKLQMTDTRGELENTWNQLTSLEARVGETLTFAFTPRFGFLTAEPYHCGTGLTARAFLHLPALIRLNRLSQVLEQLGEDEVEVASIQGSLTDAVGDVITVNNRCTIGVSDEQILQSVRTYATKLVVEEKRCRSELKEHENPDTKDRISRAFGILRHSYQLETPEAWDALSLLKLGHDLGWVTGTTHAALNELIFLSRRAHLVCEYTEELSQEELPHRRAEFLHAQLADTDLKI